MKRSFLSIVLIIALALSLTGVGVALAQPGTLLGTVSLPGNGDCSVAGTFDGTYYLTMEGGFGVGCAGNQLQIFQPPVGGNGAATLVATKTLVDAGGNPVNVSALSWDASRGEVWAAFGSLSGNMYRIALGDKTVTETRTVTPVFTYSVSGISLVDGLAWDPNDDTLYLSPDVNANVYHFLVDGTLSNTVTPKNAAGVADGSVSGVAIGAGNTLFIGRDGSAEIRLVDKTTGDFISTFATTSGRVEDLVCDPVTYAPKEAILAKDAYGSSGAGGGLGDELYEAFEVEEGTCPLAGDPVEVEKHYTFTDVAFERDNDGDGLFNEDPPDGIDNDGDGDIDEDPVDNPDGTSLGTPLPVDGDGNFVLEAVVNRKGIVTSYNPGQYYAVSTVHVLQNVDSLIIEENFTDCLDIGISALSPEKGGGGVVVVILDDLGTPLQILDANSPEVDAVGGVATVTLGPIAGNTTILVYVKFSPGLKGQEWPGELTCENTNSATVGDFTDKDQASLKVIEK
ncbi:MAG: hypothetical protein HYX84_06135 [Chloroflexi bacterium]|nr:hypothetical protein [Chloroflexota bacterium]